MNTDNKTSTVPLYKSLNEKRTQGKLITNDMPLPSRKLIEVKADGKIVANFLQMNHKKAKLFTDEETEANAVYTALAVNNLHHIAEALEEMIRQFGGVSAVTIGQKEAVLKSKYCLLNISKPIKNSRQ